MSSIDIEHAPRARSAELRQSVKSQCSQSREREGVPACACVCALRVRRRRKRSAHEAKGCSGACAHIPHAVAVVDEVGGVRRACVAAGLSGGELVRVDTEETRPRALQPMARAQRDSASDVVHHSALRNQRGGRRVEIRAEGVGCAPDDSGVVLRPVLLQAGGRLEEPLWQPRRPHRQQGSRRVES